MRKGKIGYRQDTRTTLSGGRWGCAPLLVPIGAATGGYLLLGAFGLNGHTPEERVGLFVLGFITVIVLILAACVLAYSLCPPLRTKYRRRKVVASARDRELPRS